MRAVIAPWIALTLVWGAAFGAMHLADKADPTMDQITIIDVAPAAVAGNDRYEERGLFTVDETEFDSFAPAPGRSAGVPLF